MYTVLKRDATNKSWLVSLTYDSQQAAHNFIEAMGAILPPHWQFRLAQHKEPLASLLLNDSSFVEFKSGVRAIVKAYAHFEIDYLEGGASSFSSWGDWDDDSPMPA